MDGRVDNPRKPGPIRWPVVLGLLAVVMVGIGLRALSSALRESETPPALGLADLHDPAPTPGPASADPARLPDPALARVGDAGRVIPTRVKDATPPGPAPVGMAWIPPGSFAMGSDYEPFGDARPIHA